MINLHISEADGHVVPREDEGGSVRATYFRDGKFHGQHGSDYDMCVFEYSGLPVKDGHCLSDDQVAEMLESGVLKEIDPTPLR